MAACSAAWAVAGSVDMGGVSTTVADDLNATCASIAAMGDGTSLCCVKCNSIIDKATFQGLEVDLCPKCGGLWLDRGEITRAAKLPEVELEKLRVLLRGAKGPPPVPTETVAHCPSCPGNLAEMLLGNVHVDYCGKCHGIFLDRG